MAGQCAPVVLLPAGSRPDAVDASAAGLDEFLAGAHVDGRVSPLRPHYRAVLLAMDGFVPDPSDALARDTTAALFILDGLDPLTDQPLTAVADDLVARPARLGPHVRVARRMLAAAPAEGS